MAVTGFSSSDVPRVGVDRVRLMTAIVCGRFSRWSMSEDGIFDLWMACHTQEQIAESVGCSQGEIAKSIPNGNLAERNNSDQSLASHAIDFDVPIYNVWKFKEICSESADLPESNKPSANHLTAEVAQKTPMVGTTGACKNQLDQVTPRLAVSPLDVPPTNEAP